MIPAFLRGRLSLSLALLLAGLALSPPAGAEAKVHTVYKGQRLGSIAKRYNVSVDELCRANGISRRDAIHPGQKLVIPGTEAPSSPSKKKEESRPSTKPGKPQTHVVQKGHTLGAIGGRYAVTITALCNANGIERDASLTVGQKLLVPAKSDKDGSYARQLRLTGKLDDPADSEDSADRAGRRGRSASWDPYVKPAWRRGYIKIRRYGRAWEGYVIGPKEQVLGHASNKINFVMGAREDGPQIHPRLVRLIAHVSDKFGGREVRIVSGYRTKSFVAASKHKEGRALDFSIPGVPNEALRDYLRTLDDVGVGYYPNSSFVHLDVRGYNAYWIDYAGPGEAPRKSSSRKRSAVKDQQEASDDESESEHDRDQEQEAETPDEDDSGPGDTAGTKRPAEPADPVKS